MNAERIEELWLKYQAGEALSPADRGELLTALQSDVQLRQRVMANREIDGLLRQRSMNSQQEELFANMIVERLRAEVSGDRFVRSVTSRLQEVGASTRKSSSKRVVPAASKRLRSTRQRTTRVRRSSLGIVVALAAACIALVAVFAFQKNDADPLATLDSITGAVSVQRGSSSRAGTAPMNLLDGETLVVPIGSAAAFAFADGTRVQVSGGTELRLTVVGGAKQIDLKRGELRSTIAKQPAGKPMVFVTAHASATVLGTQLRLTADAEAGRLEVLEGSVRFGRNAQESVQVNAGQFVVAAPGKPLEALALIADTPKAVAAKSDSNRRIVEDHETGLRWSRPTWSDPVDFAISSDVFASGTSSLRLNYQYRANGRTYGMIAHPMSVGADDHFVNVRVYVERADTNAILNIVTTQRDGSAWFMGDVRLSTRAPKTWFTFSVPIDRATLKNNDVGGNRYEALQVHTCGLSVFGGSAIVYIDDLTLSSEKPQP